MKKLTAIIAALSLAIAMCACEDVAQKTDMSSEATEAATTVEATEEATTQAEADSSSSEAKEATEADSSSDSSADSSSDSSSESSDSSSESESDDETLSYDDLMSVTYATWNEADDVAKTNIAKSVAEYLQEKYPDMDIDTDSVYTTLDDIEQADANSSVLTIIGGVMNIDV